MVFKYHLRPIVTFPYGNSLQKSKQHNHHFITSAICGESMDTIESEIYNFQMWQSVILTSYHYTEPATMLSFFLSERFQAWDVECVWKLLIHRPRTYPLLIWFSVTASKSLRVVVSTHSSNASSVSMNSQPEDTECVWLDGSCPFLMLNLYTFWPVGANLGCPVFPT